MLLLEFQEIDGHLHKMQDDSIVMQDTSIVMIIAKNLVTKTLSGWLNWKHGKLDHVFLFILSLQPYHNRQ